MFRDEIETSENHFSWSSEKKWSWLSSRIPGIKNSRWPLLLIKILEEYLVNCSIYGIYIIYLIFVYISLSIISIQLKFPPAKQADLVAKLVDSVGGLQMSSSLRGETFCAFNNAWKLSFFHHTNFKQSASNLEKIGREKFARWSVQYGMILKKTKDKLCKSLSHQRFPQWSGSRAVQLQEDLRKQLIDICSPLTTQLHCCLSVAFCCDSNTLCPFAWKQNQSFQYPKIIRIFPELCTNFYKSTWSTDSIAKVN